MSNVAVRESTDWRIASGTDWDLDLLDLMLDLDPGMLIWAPRPTQ